jgi:hypothetical protein
LARETNKSNQNYPIPQIIPVGEIYNKEKISIDITQLIVEDPNYIEYVKLYSKESK